MVKKLQAPSQRFSVAAKQARAEQRKAHTVELAHEEPAMEQSIVPEDILAPMPDGMGTRVTQVEWDGKLIAFVCRREDSCAVLVSIHDGPMTHMEIRNIEACRALLTFRSVLRAVYLPGAGANLAASVRQRDAQAEREQICAAIGEPSAAQIQNRL